MPSQSWKELVGEIKLAVSRGERREKQSIQNIFYIFSPSSFISFPFLTFPLLFGSVMPRLTQCLAQREAALGWSLSTRAIN